MPRRQDGHKKRMGTPFAYRSAQYEERELLPHALGMPSAESGPEARKTVSQSVTTWKKD